MWSYVWPIALVVVANTFYNIIAKSTPQNANAFLSLTVTYLVAAVVSAVLYFAQRTEKFTAEIAKLNWTALALGVCIVGLEIGYIYVYRAGWRVNTASVVANISLACVLLGVGFLLYKESVSPKQLVGIAVCMAGLALVTF